MPENWDDDFVFQPGPSTPVKRTPQIENWDNDFDDPDSPKGTLPRRIRDPLNANVDMDDDDDDDDDAHSGFVDNDEEKTVTAKSRRTALSRLKTDSPPPVPSLPIALAPLVTASTAHSQPFPRSPTISVFTHPDTLPYGSSSHLALRPTSALSSLPPSPPAHKERERRRLRKKSRPTPEGVFELASVQDFEMHTPRRSVSIERSTSPVPDPQQSDHVPTTSPSLLSRINSVKKWATRKKGSSTGPEETLSSNFQSAGGGAGPLTPPALEKKISRDSSYGSRGTPASSVSDLPATGLGLGKKNSFNMFRRVSDTPVKYSDIPTTHTTPRPKPEAVLESRRQSQIGTHKRGQSSVSSNENQRPTASSSSSPPLLPPIQLTASFSSSSSRSGDSEIPLPATVRRNKAASPQVASLGRSSGPMFNSMGPVPRRNSLGDLKIPQRISRNQSSLKRDLIMVKEFAASIEQLKVLQSTYNSLVNEINSILDDFNVRSQSPQPRSTTPEPMNTLMRPLPQQSYKQLASTFYTINSKYKISWECAELLIELGSTPQPPPTSTSSAPTMQSLAPPSEGEGIKGRERAVTLTDESTPTKNTLRSVPSTSTWTSSTNPHDLTQRQILLLKEMLTSHEPPVPLLPPPQEPVSDQEWRWGSAMNSVITLPSEESDLANANMSRDSVLDQTPPTKKRRASRLGMAGIRDMLRALKRDRSSGIPSLPVSTTSLSTDSSFGQNGPPIPHKGRRRSKTNIDLIEMGRSPRGRDLDSRLSPAFNSSSLSNSKPSPRRPSLAAIFRLGRKSQPSSEPQTSAPVSGDDDDWDYESALQGIHMTRDGTATVRASRNRSPHLFVPSVGESRPTRLSNVEELADDAIAELNGALAREKQEKKTGSVRSMPPHTLPDRKLALTPENLKPLLENAREVHMRLVACVHELRALLDTFMNTESVH